MAMTLNRVLFLLNLSKNQDILEVDRPAGGPVEAALGL
jgi:hypothetical protein